MAGFNPDEFLKEDVPVSTPTEQGFDPDAFLSSEDPEAKADLERVKDQKLQDEHGSIGAQIGTALEGAAKTTTFGLSSGAEKYIGEKLGIDALSPENQMAREEANPVAATIGSIGGLLSPTGLEGKIVGKAGKALAEKVLPHAVEEGILKGVSRSAVKYATEGALIQGGDEISKALLDAPNQSLGSAISNMGLAAVLGGGLGATGALAKAGVSKVANDVVERIRFHASEGKVPMAAVEAVETRAPKAGLDPFTKQPVEYTPSLKPEVKSGIDPFTKEPLLNTKVEPTEPVKLTEGHKMADKMIQEVLDKQKQLTAIGATVGGSLGAAVGHATGIPHLGKIGATLGGMFSSQLEPVIKKLIGPLVEKGFNAEGAIRAIKYVQEVVKGEKLTNYAIKSVLAGSTQFPDKILVTPDQREKLAQHIKQYQVNPEAVTAVPSPDHYLPAHTVALGSTIHAISTLLNTIDPNQGPKAPLDRKPQLNSTQKAQYDRILDIAQQPLTVLKDIKDGSVTSHDVLTLKCIYPELYDTLKSKLMSEVVDMTSKEEAIPFSKVMALSVFMQTPLESSLMPIAIAMAQPAPEMPPQAPNSPSGKSLATNKGNGMLKGAKSYQTPIQASQSQAAGDKA